MTGSAGGGSTTKLLCFGNYYLTKKHRPDFLLLAKGSSIPTGGPGRCLTNLNYLILNVCLFSQSSKGCKSAFINTDFFATYSPTLLKKSMSFSTVSNNMLVAVQNTGLVIQ